MAKAEKLPVPDVREELDALPAPKRERIQSVAGAALDSTAAPSMQLSLKSGVLELGYSMHSDLAIALEMADMGTADAVFHRGIRQQLVFLGSQKGSIDEDNSNFVMSVIRSIQPRDELEAMLAAQMGAIHAATMMMVRRLNRAENIPQQEAAERALNKLARTYAGHMEALKRYRTSGQQKVTVEHVTVNAGGQAIVGAVETGGGGRT